MSAVPVAFSNALSMFASLNALYVAAPWPLFADASHSTSASSWPYVSVCDYVYVPVRPFTASVPVLESTFGVSVSPFTSPSNFTVDRLRSSTSAVPS